MKHASELIKYGMTNMDDEKIFKDRLRAKLRRVSGVLYVLTFVLAVFLSCVQWVFIYGGSPSVFWISAGLYVFMAAVLLRKGRWVMALCCLMGIGMLAFVFPKAVALKSKRQQVLSNNLIK